jgi:uncharacterized protein with HEPN domain
MKDDRLYIHDMLDRAQRIKEYTKDGHTTFLSDPMIQDAVCRNFEIVGEAAKRVSDTTRNLYPEIPWRFVAGFRDVLIHQYAGVDIGLVWERVEKDLPPLIASLEKILGNLEEPSTKE